MKLPSRRTLVAVALLVALLVGGALLYRSGALSSEVLSGMLDTLGAWALPVYVALFVAGGLLQIPGIVFVFAAHVAFGPVVGFAAAYVGAIAAVTIAFVLVRVVRGKGEREPVKLPFRWAQRLLDGAEARPVVSVAILRLVFFLSPPLNVGLGFSRLKARDYIVGSALGIAAPLAVVMCGIGLI